MTKKITKTMTLSGRELSIETGRMAKQANGSVLVKYGKTSILVTATASDEPREGSSFFPLTVNFIEKMYASGKIPGGFFKREAKPPVQATLAARLIDRAIRPLFPDGFRNEVQVIITVLSFDGVNDPAMIGILGASAALTISDIPFDGPIAGVKIGKKDEFIINPTVEEIENSELNLDVAGSESSIVMMEANANEVSESDILQGIYMGHDYIKEIISLQKELQAETGKEKMEIELDIVPEELIEEIDSKIGKNIKDNARIQGKLERSKAFDKTKDSLLEMYENQLSEEEFEEKENYIVQAFEKLIKKYVRKSILEEHHRVDGRSLDDIRPLSCEIDVVPIVHGSALFTRGETQSLGTVTLGTENDEQIIDNLAEEYRKSYYLHYNFPPFSVGEVSFLRGPGRRELGHGDLAERAIRPLIPSKEDFPYTIRVVSEILESNGSSSMATVCSGTLALMAAGVPLKKPVAGIANGLIKKDDNFVVLTDIMGLEDHLGDMDFKVTGTRDGITAMQMDIKIHGITREIMEIALEKAKKARMIILDKIVETIPEPRKELAETAPRIESFKVDKENIGDIIGKGGDTIKDIIAKTGVEINIDDDGTVAIYSPDEKSIKKAKEIIENIVKKPEMNKIYDGVVTRTESYGAFVSFMNNSESGLVHISQLSNKHVPKVSDMLKVGDKVRVKFTGYSKGKVKLSMKNVEGNPKPSKSSRSHSNKRYKKNKR